jgi:hypothetical protein
MQRNAIPVTGEAKGRINRPFLLRINGALILLMISIITVLILAIVFYNSINETKIQEARLEVVKILLSGGVIGLLVMAVKYVLDSWEKKKDQLTRDREIDLSTEKIKRNQIAELLLTLRVRARIACECMTENHRIHYPLYWGWYLFYGSEDDRKISTLEIFPLLTKNTDDNELTQSEDQLSRLYEIYKRLPENTPVNKMTWEEIEQLTKNVYQTINKKFLSSPLPHLLQTINTSLFKAPRSTFVEPPIQPVEKIED